MATLIEIDDLHDPRVEAYRNMRDRDLRGAHGGRFIAEGESVIKVLLGRGPLAPESLYQPESLLVAANRVETLRPYFALWDIPVHVVSPEVMTGVVGFAIHRGLLAIGRRTPPLPAGDLLVARPPLAVGLAGVTNHDNVGGIFRNAAAFGVGAALIDGATADPLYRKAIRVSVGGVLRVPYAVVAGPEAMRDAFAAVGYAVLALSPRGARRLDEVDRSRPTALMLGAEGAGLPDAVMDTCETVRIDMAGGFDSLNVATTCGIALYELCRR
jgi:tRNA G18 (ribose-2'-O)-methylase SpoU